ncbi:MAG: YgfZ/GcvT domain-containing protein [Rhodothalassiaceae bacterium]
MTTRTARLEGRGVLAISGEDRFTFLQGIVTNDVMRLEKGRALYAALLTPQGKYLFDFFLVPDGDRILLDCEGARRDELMRRLLLYRLRARVEIVDLSADLALWVLFGDAAAELPEMPGAMAPLAGGTVFHDPRTAEIGWRAILPAGVTPAFAAGAPARYEHLRVTLGLPDGSRDLEVEKTLALEANLDLLQAIDFNKGCYVGQEITARTKHRGKVRRRLLPVEVAGGEPVARGQSILAADRRVGELRSVSGSSAIALLRLEALQDSWSLRLEDGEREVRLRRPDWLAGLEPLDVAGSQA